MPHTPRRALHQRRVAEPKEAFVSDFWAVAPQYLLPKQALTRLAGVFARSRAGALTTWVIRRFVARYRVNMAEAANPDPASYASFNDFWCFRQKATVTPHKRCWRVVGKRRRSSPMGTLPPFT